MSPLADWLPPVRFTKSLRLRLLLVSILVEGLMLSLLVANGARLIRSHLMENTELRLEAQESSFNIALAGLLAARDYSSVQSVLDGWGGIPGITYMAVADASGRVVAAHGMSLNAVLPEPDAGLSYDQPLYHGAFDVAYLGQRYGRAYYGMDTSFLRKAESELVHQSVLIALTEIALTLALLAGIGFWLTRHLTMLTRAALKVARGDFAVSFPKMGEDEVGVLSRAFDTMAKAVEVRIAQLDEGQRRFRAIADYTYGWECWFDVEGRLRWVNPAVERISGYSPRDCHAMADFPLGLVEPEDREDLRIHLADAKLGTTGDYEEFRIRHKDGHLIWVAMSWLPVLDDDGKSLGFRVSLRDITERRQSAEMLIAAKGELERLLFAASHDLQEPVRSVLIHLQRLEREVGEALTGEAAHCLQLVRTGGNQLDLLVKGLQAFSRSDRPMSAFIPLELTHLVEKVTTHLASQAWSANPMFDIDPLPVLPGDPGLLFIMFEAVIGNGVKFVEPGIRPAVRITAQVESHGDVHGWRIDVMDNGIGIEEPYLQSIFRPFSRLHSRATYPGAGLGLASAQKIAAIHGGSIWLESKPSHGTTAHIWLPRPSDGRDRGHVDGQGGIGRAFETPASCGSSA